MHTVTVNAGDIDAYVAALRDVVMALRDGALVVFPTETVYGLGASAARPDAVRRVRESKRYDDQRPFTVHLGRRSDARKYVRAASPVLRRLARKGWPGPLTLIAEEPHPEQTEIGRSYGADPLREIYHEGTVGLRCPDHPVAQRLLVEADVPIVASSANLRGAAPPFDLAAALRDLDGKVDYAVDAGRTRFNSASTVVAVRGDRWEVQRAGVIDERTLRRWAKAEALFVCTGNSCRSPMAEYMFRHFLARSLEYTLEDLSAAGYVVTSAGAAAAGGGDATEGALAELARLGIDGNRHRSRPLTVELVQRADRIYVMSPEHRSAVIDLVPGAAARVQMLDPGGPVLDPLGGGPDAYRRCAAHIEQWVRKRVREFLDEDLDW